MYNDCFVIDGECAGFWIMKIFFAGWRLQTGHPKQEKRLVLSIATLREINLQREVISDLRSVQSWDDSKVQHFNTSARIRESVLVTTPQQESTPLWNPGFS